MQLLRNLKNLPTYRFQPEVAANYLVEQFAAERTSVVEMQRGMFLNSAVPIVNKSPVPVS